MAGSSRHPSDGVPDRDKKFISDVSMHTLRGSSLSTKQADVVVKLLRQHLKLFQPADRTTVETICNTLVYRKPLYQSVEAPKEVRWVAGSTFLFRFNYNPAIQADIRSLRSELDMITQPTRVPDARGWRVIVDSANIKEVMAFIQRYNFQFDDEVLEMFMHMQNNANQPNTVTTTEDTIRIEINNDVLAALWLEDMEYFRDV